MKLLTVGSLPPEWGGPARGGAATFHLSLLTALVQREQVKIVGVLPPSPLAREAPVPVWPRPEEVPRARHYEELLERLQPDVVLMNHFAHTIGAAHVRLGAPIPALGVAQSWHNITFSGGEMRAQALALTREALGGLGGLVSVSHHMAVEGRDLGLAYPPLTEIIHNPVPPLYMEEGVAPQTGERTGVVFVGSLIPRKRPGALLEAAPLLPGLRVTLIGEGELENELSARLAELGLGDRVGIASLPVGERHLAWIRDALLAAEALCLPSSSEGLPLAFVEALACGTPIVGFGPAVREIRDELGIDVGEPLVGDGPDEIAAAIERVLSTGWDHAELRRATLDRFGLDRVTDRYVEILGQLADRSAGNPSLSGGRRRACRAVGDAQDVDVAPICVLGPSRSGTSLTTRLLNLAGVYLGPGDELLGEDGRRLAGEGDRVIAKAKRSNPAGHWEHYRLMRLNERILRTLGGSWREPPLLPDGWESNSELDELREEARAIVAESFAGHGLWGWKDPRSSLTLPFWRDLLPAIRCVICVRHPLEVAESLRVRDGIELDRGVEQWTRYLAAALVNTAGRPRMVIRYESYFREPATVAAALARFVGREGVFEGPDGQEALSEAIDPRLWRHRNRGEPPGRELPTDAASLFRVAELIASSGNRTEVSDGIDERLEVAADLYANGVLRRALPVTASMTS